MHNPTPWHFMVGSTSCGSYFVIVSTTLWQNSKCILRLKKVGDLCSKDCFSRPELSQMGRLALWSSLLGMFCEWPGPLLPEVSTWCWILPLKRNRSNNLTRISFIIAFSSIKVKMPVERMRMRPWLEEQINSNKIPGLKWLNEVRHAYIVK